MVLLFPVTLLQIGFSLRPRLLFFFAELELFLAFAHLVELTDIHLLSLLGCFLSSTCPNAAYFSLFDGVSVKNVDCVLQGLVLLLHRDVGLNMVAITSKLAISDLCLEMKSRSFEFFIFILNYSFNTIMPNFHREGA